MALIFPSFDIIRRLHIQPTAGEWRMLNYLNENLDNSYEVFFQPFLNGDNPDIAIMRKGSGVLIIEVKDWDLRSYYIDTKTKWRLLSNDVHIKSPFQQLDSYKENLFKLHSEELFDKQIKNKKHWATVNCAVYFHNASESQINDFIYGKFNSDEYKAYRDHLSHFAIFGNNSLNTDKLNSTLSRFWLNKASYFFDDSIYFSFRRYFKPPTHEIEEGIELIYTREQQVLIQSEIRPRRKIKGVAGSGKTYVLAKRAVNAHTRTEKTVLVLTYNLSLKNYIHDRINDVREKFEWKYFYITNYHQFFKSQANNYNLPIYSLAAWQDVNFFEQVKDSIIKYDVVLIDEVQDYQQEWIDIITKYFTHQDTEFVVFGDEKQNIYERELDENNEPIVRTIRGDWNRSLNTSFRFSNNIGTIALKFQKRFFNEKYTTDELRAMSQLDFEQRIIAYYFFHQYTPEILFETIYRILGEHEIHSSDVGILCSKVELLRAIDLVIRTKKHEKTTVTFERHEEFTTVKEAETKRLKEKGLTDAEIEMALQKEMQEKLEDIRKIRKNHFWMKTGTAKLSTTHSFKGWETETLFLIIENEEDGSDFTNDELIYTGITRAKKNLIIFNLNNYKYDEFFKSVIELQYEIGEAPMMF